MSDGPGIMIVGHQQDHALDLGDERPGPSATRKRDAEGSLAERILHLVQIAARLSVDLQAEPAIREVIMHPAQAGEADAVTVERSGASRDPFAVRVLLDQPRPLIQWAEGVQAAAE